MKHTVVSGCLSDLWLFSWRKGMRRIRGRRDRTAGWICTWHVDWWCRWKNGPAGRLVRGVFLLLIAAQRSVFLGWWPWNARSHRHQADGRLQHNPHFLLTPSAVISIYLLIYFRVETEGGTKRWRQTMSKCTIIVEWAETRELCSLLMQLSFSTMNTSKCPKLLGCLKAGVSGATWNDFHFSSDWRVLLYPY